MNTFTNTATSEGCKNCGKMGHEHDKKKVFEDGMAYYRYIC